MIQIPAIILTAFIGLVPIKISEKIKNTKPLTVSIEMLTLSDI